MKQNDNDQFFQALSSTLASGISIVSLTIFFYYFARNMDKSLGKKLVFHLCFSDFIFAITSFPEFFLNVFLNKTLIDHPLVCQFIGFVTIFSTVLGYMIAGLIVFSVYYLIRFGRISPTVVNYRIVILYIISVLVAVLPVLSQDYGLVEPLRQVNCWINFQSATSYVVQGFITFIYFSIFAFSLAMVIKIYRISKNNQQNNRNSNFEEEQIQKRRLIKNNFYYMFLYPICFFFTWSCCIYDGIATMFQKQIDLLGLYGAFVITLPFLNGFFNSIIYGSLAYMGKQDNIQDTIIMPSILIRDESQIFQNLDQNESIAYSEQ